MDELMLRRAQNGDSAAFEQLVTPYEQMLWRVCWRHMRHQEDAADCLQETMLKAWRMLPQYRGEGSFEGWLHRICTGICIDHIRKRTRREADSIDAMGEDGFQMRDAAPLPHEQAEARERQEALAQAIDQLPEEMRDALILTQLEGRSYEDVAGITGASIGTVKSRISRARQKLIAAMQRWHDPSHAYTSERRSS